MWIVRSESRDEILQNGLTETDPLIHLNAFHDGSVF